MERPEATSSQNAEAETTPRGAKREPKVWSSFPKRKFSALVKCFPVVAADVLSQSNWQLSKSTDDLFRHFLTMSGDALRTSSNSIFSLNQSSTSPFSAAQSCAYMYWLL
jgi:hypothetical protein